MKTKNNFYSEEGFSLLEVLVALTIFAVAILGMNAMQVSTIQGNSQANRITVATNSVSAIVENLMAVDYDDPMLADGTDHNYDGTDIPLSDLPAYVQSLTWDVVDDDRVDSTKTITVNVTWQKMSGSTTPSFSLTFVKPEV